MLELPESIEPLFLAAGWERKATTPSAAGAMPSEERVRRILQEFGGLRIGQTGSGAEVAASDVRFHSAVRAIDSRATSAWSRQVGRLTAFATAHNDHMLLFINDEGICFVFTDPDERLYNAGPSFGELMRRLLQGYRVGPRVERDD